MFLTSMPTHKQAFLIHKIGTSSQILYTSATLDDNTSAFYGLVNDNLKGLSQMMSDQPNIWR